MAMSEDKKECFVIMPISDAEGYDKGHFTRVYYDIIKPAVESAGHKPIRADEVVSSNLIQLDIVERLIYAPLAICDISSRNPNVFYELGIRHAFNKPVVLMKDNVTPNAFDISSFRYIEYTKEMGYRDVTSAIKQLKEFILSTVNDWNIDKGVNSIIKLLPDTKENPTNLISEFILQEAQQLCKDLNSKNLFLLKDLFKNRLNSLEQLCITKSDKLVCEYLRSKFYFQYNNQIFISE